MTSAIQSDRHPLGTTTRLLELAKGFESPTVSFFTPWGRGDGRRANEIRIKHGAKEARNQLEERDTSPRKSRAIESLLEERLVEIELGTGHEALALFTDGSRCEIRPLPAVSAEAVYVADRPFVRPLLSSVQSDRAFLLLELSLRSPRLLLGSRWSLEETATPLPDALESVVGGEVESRGVQFRSQKAQATSEALFHGHGGGHDDVVPELEKYLREIDKSLNEDWAESGLPLVLAGVERERGHFRKVSRYRPIAELDLPLSPERDPARDERLHEQATAHFEEQWRAAHAEKVASLRGHLVDDGETAVRELGDLLVRAYGGQLARLCIRRERQVWGHFDPTNGELVEAVSAESPGDEELLNLAALLTLEHRGDVLELDRADLEAAEIGDLWPVDAPAIGVMRTAREPVARALFLPQQP